MNSVLFLLVCSLLIGESLAASALPSWVTNPNIDAGEVVSVNFTAGDSLFAASRQKQQHFNKSNFAVVPRVILSMIGYGNLPPGSASTPIGFRTVINSRNSTHFNYTTTAYAVVIYLLNYLYLAIQYEDAAFFTDTQFLTFNATTNSNVFNEFAAVRYDTIAIANPGGMVNNNFTGQDIQFIAFPTGFNVLPKSGRSYFSINASILNATHYSVNISTIGNNILYEISFSLLAFNRGVIMANYTVFIDLVLSTLIGNSTAYVTPPFTPQQYMFRNCLAGGIHAEYPATASFVYYYTMSSPANNFIIWRTFNNRVRSCPVNLTYYEPTSGLCYDICPSLYHANATSLICLPCHYSCQQCSGPYSSTLCSSCSLTNKRTLNGTQCLCDIGFYDNGVALCLPCDPECLTCTNGTNSSCSSCSASLFRQLDSSLPVCNCQSEYYENTTCLSCSSQIRACLTCNYDQPLNNLTCLTCDASLLRILSNDSKSCPCQPLSYQDPSNFSCIACPVGCLICQPGPVCSSCDSTLNRTMGSGNVSCDCIAAYYQNGSGQCVKCQQGCLSCTLGASGPVCSSCDTLLNREMTAGNTSCACKVGFYLDSTNVCVMCPIGCLSCSLLSGSVICSSCDSTLQRTMGTSNLSCPCSPSFYEAANSSCQACQLNCLTCSLSGSTSVPPFTQICNSCISGYNLANSTCVLGNSICGDGVLSGLEQCDDENLLDADGCSSICKIEANHVCVNNASLLNHSLCYYSYPIGLNPQLVYKIPGQNSVKLEISVDAPLCNPNLLQNYLQQTSYVLLLDRSRLLQAAWIAIPTKQVSYSSSSFLLTIIFDYSQDIDLSQKEIQITPSSATSSSYLKYFYASPSAKASLSAPYNNLPTKFYSTSSLQAASAFSKVFLALVGLYWIAVIIALIAQKGAVGTECMLVLQLTYLTLLDIPQLGQCWSSLQLSGKFTFGYNLSLLKNSEVDDLKALELDSNLPNTLNITLGILLILFLSVIGVRIYEWWLQRKKRKEIMEMNESSENRSTKIQKQEQYRFQRVFVVVIDIMLTLLFLTTPVAIIGASFTSPASLIGNLIEVAVMAIITIAAWLLFYRRSQTYAWRTVSFRSIIVNPAKMTVNLGLKILLKHYYLIQFICISIIALMIAFMKTAGMVVFILLLLGSAAFSFLHFKVQIYIDRLHSLRAVSNSAALGVIMLLHLVQYFAANSLDTSLSLVVVTFLLMLTVLTINLIVLFILWKRQNEKERDQAHLDMEMKQMANQLGLGLANMSMLQGQDLNYGSIKHNNSRDYTKPKVIEQDYDSTRSELLSKSKNQKLFGLIEEKIRELKEFKKNIQAQVEGSNFISEDTTEGNNNLEGILDQLENKSNIVGDISDI